ncbi:MAG: cell division protein FtsW [Acidobacteria bacterium]|nr:cell division protein FtsW [Acidobacteriota bacterium]
MTCQMSKGQLLFVGISVLTLCGLLMVYSASMVATAQDGKPSHYFFRQTAYAGIGYLLMIMLMFIDYRRWLQKRTILLLLIFSLVCLVLVYAYPSIKGARRAIHLGPGISFQPSEIAKLALFLYLAAYLEKNREQIRQSVSRLYPCLTVLGIFCALICFEPDLGQVICILTIAVALMFVAGLDWKYIWIAAGLSVPAFYFLVWLVPFRRKRILDWLTALFYPLKADYQIKQSIIAIGHGGLIGLGFGDGRQKLSFLPEAPTDFIFSVIGEEFGLAGSIVVVVVFLVYLYLGIKISIQAPDAGGFFLGLAITLMVVLPTFINMSTAVALLPTKGLTLPFISRGGSSLLVNLMATGILLNIASQRRTDED